MDERGIVSRNNKENETGRHRSVRDIFPVWYYPGVWDVYLCVTVVALFCL